MQKKLYNVNAIETKVEDESVAKHVHFDNGTDSYYVKVSKSGSDAGFFVNPQSMWYVELNAKRFDKRTKAKSVYEFKSVKKEVFESYLHFLKTKNQTYLRWAERESING